MNYVHTVGRGQKPWVVVEYCGTFVKFARVHDTVQQIAHWGLWHEHIYLPPPVYAEMQRQARAVLADYERRGRAVQLELKLEGL